MMEFSHSLALEPTPVNAFSSAFAVDITSPAWLSLSRRPLERTMPTADIYGFAHADIEAARSVIERALSIRLEQAQEHDYPEYYYYRVELPSGPCVQIRRNSGLFIRWKGDPSNRWHPDYALLVFVHGPRQELVTEYLRNAAPGLSFLETKETM